MQQEKSELTNLFYKCLGNAELEVRTGFWEELENDMKKYSQRTGQRIFSIHTNWRWAMLAASIILILVMGSMTLFYYNLQEDMKDSLTEIAACMSVTTSTDSSLLTLPVIGEVPPRFLKKNETTAYIASHAKAEVITEENPVSYHFSIRITQNISPDRERHSSVERRDYANVAMDNGMDRRGTTDRNSFDMSDEDVPQRNAITPSKEHNWAVEASLGTSLPKSGYNAMKAEVDVERKLGKRLSLKAGLQYCRMKSDETLHVLGIPIKVNILLAKFPNVDLYAVAGGMVEKCVAGTSDNSLSAEPLQTSLLAGLGVRYKVNGRFALFAEPTISHHFDTSSDTRSLYTERPTNINLSCGLRMTY